MSLGRLNHWLVTATALYLGLAFLSFSMSQPPAPGPGENVETYAQFSGEAGADANSWQRIRRTPAGYVVSYGFRNFNQDPLEISVNLPARSVQESVAEFGYTDREMQALDTWYRRAQEGAIARSKELFFTGKVTAPDQARLQAKLAHIRERNRQIQADLDQTMADLADEYRQRRVRLYTEKGFRFKDAKTVEVDFPAMVRRNAPRLAPAAMAFARIAQQRGYEMEELVGAVTAMAQTAIRYESIDDREGERTIAAAIPPPKSFAIGQGNCGTKTGVIGSILINWPNLRMVGLAIPGHYLMAVHRIPARGEFFVDHEGIPYVMIEAAGPAWLPPGQVGEHTEAYLKSGQLFAIQPFTL